MVACPSHILESTKGIEIKLGTYIDVNERMCRRQEVMCRYWVTIVIVIW